MLQQLRFDLRKIRTHFLALMVSLIDVKKKRINKHNLIVLVLRRRKLFDEQLRLYRVQYRVGEAISLRGKHLRTKRT